MKASSAIRKGKDLEDYVADQIVALGIDPKARRSAGSGNGNREKADIVTSMTVLGQNAGIECKNTKTVAIPDWWRQVKKLEVLGREPILAFKLPGEPYEATLATVYLDTLLRLIASQGKPHIEVGPAPSRDGERALSDLKRAVHNFQRHFPGVLQ